MAKRSKTSDRTAAYFQVFGSFDPVRSFTHISPQRLTAIANGSKATAQERSRISAFGRRLEEGNVSYSIQAASEKRGVSIGQVGRELQDVARGAFVPKERMDLGTLSYKLGIDPMQLEARSKQPVYNSRGRLIREARGISEAYVDNQGRVIGYGSDGKPYVGFTVTNKQNGKARFFWGRFETLGYMTAADAEDHYGDMDGYDYAVALAEIEADDF